MHVAGARHSGMHDGPAGGATHVATPLAAFTAHVAGDTHTGVHVGVTSGFATHTAV